MIPTDQAGEVNAVLEIENLADPALRLLVITLDAAAPRIDPARESVIYVGPSDICQDSASPTDARTLPMSSDAFDVVIGYRVVRPGCDAMPLLREAIRVLRKDGTLLLVTDPQDFALLPPQGPAHLTQRALGAAGIHGAKFHQHGPRSVAVIHKRQLQRSAD